MEVPGDLEKNTQTTVRLTLVALVCATFPNSAVSIARFVALNSQWSLFIGVSLMSMFPTRHLYCLVGDTGDTAIVTVFCDYAQEGTLADVLCSLLDSRIAASASVTAFAKEWDVDYVNEPGDVTLRGALHGISAVAVPEVACPLMTLLRARPGATLTTPDAEDRTVTDADEHPGVFLNPYFRALSTSPPGA